MPSLSNNLAEAEKLAGFIFFLSVFITGFKAVAIFFYKVFLQIWSGNSMSRFETGCIPSSLSWVSYQGVYGGTAISASSSFYSRLSVMSWMYRATYTA